MPSFWDENGNLVSGRYLQTGKNRKVVMIVPALAIRDTNSATFLVDFTKYDSISFEIRSTLDQQVVFDMTWNGNSGQPYYKPDGTSLLFSGVAMTSQRPVLLTDTHTGWELLNKFAVDTAYVRLKCSTAPTTGSVYVKLYGITRGVD